MGGLSLQPVFSFQPKLLISSISQSGFCPDFHGCLPFQPHLVYVFQNGPGLLQSATGRPALPLGCFEAKSMAALPSSTMMSSLDVLDVKVRGRTSQQIPDLETWDIPSGYLT